MAVFIDISKNGKKVIKIIFLFKLGYNDDGYILRIHVYNEQKM